MNIYRFTWGCYSDKGEEWFTHDRRMSKREVVQLLVDTWALVRDEWSRSCEEYEEALHAWRKRYPSGARTAADYDSHPVQGHTLYDLILTRAGFVPIKKTADVDVDAIADWFADTSRDADALDERVRRLWRDNNEKEPTS